MLLGQPHTAGERFHRASCRITIGRKGHPSPRQDNTKKAMGLGAIASTVVGHSVLLTMPTSTQPGPTVQCPGSDALVDDLSCLCRKKHAVVGSFEHESHDS